MEFSLPQPLELAKDGLLLRQWSNFSLRFQCHMNTNLSHDPKISSLLLFAACHELNSMCESLKIFDVDLSKLNKILEIVEQVCLPRLFLLFERFRYFTLEQDASDSLESFLNTLRKQGDMCEFGKIKESVMTSALVNRVAGANFKQSFFNIDGLCFDDAVNICSGGAPADNNVSFNEASTVSQSIRDSKRQLESVDQQEQDSEMFMVPISDGLDDEEDTDNQVVATVTSVRQKGVKKRRQKTSRASTSGKKLFLCFMCDNEYATRKSFRRHIASKHQDCKEYFCKHCLKAFRNRTECITHCKGHTSSPQAHVNYSKYSDNTEFMCWYCQEMFTSLDDYKKHCLTHSAVRVFSCDLCQKKNHTLIRMFGHLKGHLNPKHRCPICANCFGRAELLEAHLATHVAQPLHQCQICSKSFVSADRLHGHMRTHSGEKRFTCELCGKSFSQKMSFDYHKRWHAGEKPYECEICGRRARSFGDLRKHKRLHSDKRPYVCEVCGKSFRFTSNLNRHRRGHSGKRSFACDVCGRTFIYNEGLRDHIKAGRCPGRKTEGDQKSSSRIRRPRAPTILNPHHHMDNNDYSPINYTTTHHAPEVMQHELSPSWQYMVRGEPDGTSGLVMMPQYF